MKKITTRQPIPIEQLTWKHDEIPEKPVNDGTGASGGIGNVNLDGAVRLAGANRDETAKAIRNYAGIKYVYGTQTDLANAEMILGDQLYKYIRSDIAGFTLPAFTANDIIVGGTGAPGGIPDVNLNGAVRLAGANRDLTAQAVANYVNPINVYGGQIDINNAKNILGSIGYNYIDSSQAGFVMPSFTSNDIVVGGTGASGGIPDVYLNGANRLAGINRDATAETIRKYRDSKRVYGDKVDIDIAKSILGYDNYTYILSDLPGFKLPIFCSNNIIVGGTGASGGIGNVNLNGAVRLAGANRDETAKAIRNYAGIKSDDEKESNLILSSKGIQFLANHEGCPTRNGLVVMYNDPAGHCTIGYGHLIHLGPIDGRASENPYKNGITKAQALDLFRSDVAKYETAVNSNVKVQLTQYQFDALVSFTYNIGIGGFESSSALRELNKDNYNDVPSKMLLWNKPAVIIGRRTDEANLFKTGNYGF